MISFRLRTKRQNCRGYVPCYERTPKNGWFDIYSVFTTHVETVVLLSQREKSTEIELSLEVEPEISKAEAKATYDEIRKYIKDRYGFNVTNLNIAQVKQRHGIIERVNYNVGSGKSKVPNTPPEKVEAIEKTLKHFKMI